MAINNDDVKLFESQRLSDEEDGGGRATGTEVIDGNINNLFQDISRIDRTIGDVALRKAYVGISTDNNDAYLGSHLILTEPPKDQNVSVLLFNTDDQTDERKNARNRIEAYVVPGTTASFELLGDQTEGQRSIAGIQREESRLPEVGEVYRLYDPVTKAEQYVRLTKVESRMEVFTYQYGDSTFMDFERRRIDMEISAPLSYTFPGGVPTPGGTQMQVRGNELLREKTLVQGTQIADASRYYGIKPASATISKGDLSVRVDSLYAPLVPSARVESPVVDQYGGYTAKRMVATAAGVRNVSPKFVHLTGSQSRAFLQTGALPGTITLTMDGGTFVDNRKGSLVHSSGTNNFSSITIDYENGEINAYRNSGKYTSTASVTYQPAAAVVGSAISGTEDVSSQNRGFNYTFNFAEAKPKPGTLVISYIALGKWQDVSDPGNGQMDGSGKGNIDFSTGSVAVTFDAVPDPDSKLVFSYITQGDEEITRRTGSLPVERFAFRHTTEKPGIKPGSVTIRYLASGQNKTLTDQGNGLLNGDGSGSVYYASGELGFVLNAVPDNGTEIEIEYQEGAVAGGQVDVTIDSAGLMTGTISGAPLLPGSVQVQFAVERESVSHNGRSQGFAEYSSTYNRNKSFNDNGNGGWQNGTGTIDYQTGEFTIQATENYSIRKYNAYSTTHSFTSWGETITRTSHRLSSANVTKTEAFPGSTVTSKAQGNSLSHLPNTESLGSPELTIDLLPLIDEPLLPGSLIFDWNGESYFDRDGLLYKNISTETNAGTQVGTIDYTGGVATLAVYPSGTVSTATLTAAATFSADFKTNSVAFRTPGAPVRAGSLQLTAVRASNADIITATADFNGNINTSEVEGKFDATTGWCEVFFTDGTDPIQIIPQSVRYNCVIETSLPMDADLIGLDPVRLPADGRVPIYRPGDIVVISHKKETDAGTPTAGQNFVLTRDHQAEIVVEDSAGKLLDPAQYTADKPAGKLTFADPLLLQNAGGESLTAPFKITDRVEHMSVVSDAQINGELSIIAPVPWDLPAGETTISSAVVYGDLQARVHSFFSQKVWDSGNPNWTDERNEDNTTAKYNTVNYPIQVANKGSIHGKWAIIFTSGTAFTVVEEKLGIIDTGTTGTNTAPINPETGTPYFSILADGWGVGWSPGNVVRFNTDGCLAPVWICRTVLSGQGTETDDKFTLQIRGDAD
ncbi:hypothetical protein [Endozoicomonas euniceicola]|uniref:Uncharacterized protein n=1 Tax=Endozoicomonas euniceicola TaxID=1234143 RepID=A0ABY6GVT0_9GAMM|nr:hypothetical protein [Endozoicomonas euniceicola]UYM16186.1 hypothetical protein NX720_25885 [Endozoicomonas euniceicola]